VWIWFSKKNRGHLLQTPLLFCTKFSVVYPPRYLSQSHLCIIMNSAWYTLGFVPACSSGRPVYSGIKCPTSFKSTMIYLYGVRSHYGSPVTIIYETMGHSTFWGSLCFNWLQYSTLAGVWLGKPPHIYKLFYKLHMKLQIMHIIIFIL